MAKEMLVTTTEKIPGHNYEVLARSLALPPNPKTFFPISALD